jgi:hypothetical protein
MARRGLNVAEFIIFERRVGVGGPLATIAACPKITRL